MSDVSQMSDAELLAAYAMPALTKQESGGQAGIQGPQTKYGRALGMTQLLPATAQEMAQKTGLPWRPELLTDKSPEGAAYQAQLGQAYLQQGIEKTGSLEGGLHYYHGGPNPAQWGPKTEAYTRAVLNGVGQAPAGPDLTKMSDADLMAMYQAQALKPAKPALAHSDSIAPGAIPQVSSAGMRAALNVPVDTGSDMLHGLVSGARQTLNQTIATLPQANPLDMGLNMMKQAATVADAIHQRKLPTSLMPSLPGANITPTLDAASNANYKPQTIWGERAQTLGQALPMALAPGSAGARAANVVLPALGSQGAGEAARGLGLPDWAQQAARLAGGAAGGVAANVRVNLPARPVNPDVALLQSEGVQMLPGQAKGGVAKAAENAFESLPFAGTKIKAGVQNSFDTFNRAATNRALAPIGETLPDHIETGSAAIKYAGDKLSAGYEAAVPQGQVRLDPAATGDIAKALDNTHTMGSDAQARLMHVLDQRLTSQIPESGKIDGQTYKNIQSGLDYEIANYGKSGDPDHQAITSALKGVQAAVEGAARRQDPHFASTIDALDKGWAEITRLETAASKSRDLSGKFTPAQYAQAVRSGANTRVRNRGVARGEALSQDLASAAMRVLPPQMPNSGTADRAIWSGLSQLPGAGLGAAVGAATGGPVGAALGTVPGVASTFGTGALVARGYTPEAIAAFNTKLASQIARTKKPLPLATIRPGLFGSTAPSRLGHARHP